MFKNLNPGWLGVSGHQSEIIELALTYGFAGMDLNMVEFATRARLKGMAYARRLIDSARLRIGTFPLPFEWDRDDADFQKDLKKLSEYAGCAAELGCLRCTAVLAPAGDSRPYHENFEFHRQRLSEVCATLRPAGVRLAVGFQAAENLRRDHSYEFIHELDSLNLLLNMVAAPNLGLLLDIWDVVAGGGSLESVRKLSARQIVAVQVAEMPAEVVAADLDDKSRLLPGADHGRIDVAGLLRILKEGGYEGPITAKPSRSAFPTRRRDLVVKQTSEALDKVWHNAGLPIPAKVVVATARD